MVSGEAEAKTRSSRGAGVERTASVCQDGEGGDVFPAHRTRRGAVD